MAPFLRVIRPMSMPGPAALHVDCCIRGQGLRLVVTNNTTVSLGVVHPAGNPLAPIQGFGRIDSPPHLLLHLAFCVHIWHPVSAMQSEQTC